VRVGAIFGRKCEMKKKGNFPILKLKKLSIYSFFEIKKTFYKFYAVAKNFFFNILLKIPKYYPHPYPSQNELVYCRHLQQPLQSSASGPQLKPLSYFLSDSTCQREKILVN
jgi:hypothetical protein